MPGQQALLNCLLLLERLDKCIRVLHRHSTRDHFVSCRRTFNPDTNFSPARANKLLASLRLPCIVLAPKQENTTPSCRQGWTFRDQHVLAQQLHLTLRGDRRHFKLFTFVALFMEPND